MGPLGSNDFSDRVQLEREREREREKEREREREREGERERERERERLRGTKGVKVTSTLQIESKTTFLELKL